MSPRAASGASDLVGRTYHKVRDLIVSGRLAPGTRIIESELSDRLGVSRTPVRSVLHRLQQEGYIVSSETGRNARLSVAPLTKEDGRELLHVLGALEGVAAAWAAASRDGVRSELVRELTRINTEIEQHLDTGHPDSETVFQLHSRFHRAPLEAVGAPRLLSLHDTIRPQVERYRRLYISTVASGNFAAEVEEHRTIIEALQSGDPVATQLAVQENWGRAAERLGRIVAAVGDRGSW